ncbi:MAG: CCA tRNA nucleotidyltransferase [Pirellulales bacterium]|nr:CCA tRNA nucleotidyltransferase [Pirellulales bacterium]
MPGLLPENQRLFATQVVRELRDAGFEAYWAGGCVRDHLLGRRPKDYDVATSARPEQVRSVFGRRRTLAIGAAFGVITVLGPPRAGQIEIATFRADLDYSDGRHPDGVTFCNAEEDALRRDFTINGMFYDPIDERVIDYVDGQKDLQRGILRAIGSPQERFTEDKLRMLRAVRFTSTFGFQMDKETLAAVRRMAEQITIVSVERIAAEMRRMLTERGLVVAVWLLLETGLAKVILPEIVCEERPERIERTLSLLKRFDKPSFALALAALLREFVDARGAAGVCSRWKLSCSDSSRVEWLIGCGDVLRDAAEMPWSKLQSYMVDDGIEELLALAEAVAAEAGESIDFVEFCREKLRLPDEVLHPTPLLTGDDLIEHGLTPGPIFKRLLARTWQAQLDGEIETKQAALAIVDRMLQTELE